MALPAGMTYEVRQGGFGSGGYDLVQDRGTDFSQQAAPEIMTTDWETKNLDYDRLYSATQDAKLIADKVDNTIRITGDGGSGAFTAGIYHITGSGSDGGGNYVDIDRDCANANANDGLGALGGCIDIELLDGTILVAGNIVHVRAGTYTLASNLNFATHGSADLPIQIRGYNSVRGDEPRGNDRPLIDGGNNYYYKNGNRYLVDNLRVLSKQPNAFEMNGYCRARNIYANNSSASANRYALRATGSFNMFIDCDGESVNGCGLAGGINCKIWYTRLTACNVGAWPAATNMFFGCIIHDNTTSCIEMTYGDSVSILHCTFANSPEGVDFGNLDNGIMENCQLYNLTNGVDGTNRNYLDYNNWHSNGSDIKAGSTVEKGDHATAIDPPFTNPAGGDFSGVVTPDARVMQLSVS